MTNQWLSLQKYQKKNCNNLPLEKVIISKVHGYSYKNDRCFLNENMNWSKAFRISNKSLHVINANKNSIRQSFRT